METLAVPTQYDIQSRIEQFGLLRSALRALEASSPDASSFGLEESFQQLRKAIADVRASIAKPRSDGASPASPAAPVSLDPIDHKLFELQAAIVTEARSIRLSQLRATLPAIKRQNPEELKALLDLCLMSHASGSPWWNLIDYLITLLSYEEEGGRRYVARDPTSVTPRLEGLCALSDHEKNSATDALAQVFRDASVAIEQGIPPRPIVEKMRSAKHQAMRTLLIPDLLKALVGYNIALSNQRAELIETQRVMEEAELEAFERQLGTKASVQEAPVQEAPIQEAPIREAPIREAPIRAAPVQEAPIQEDGPAARPSIIVPVGGSALESQALRAIMEVIHRCLLRQEPGEGPEVEVVMALDLSRLSAYEEGALRKSERDPVAIVVATAATVGLIGRSLDALGDRLVRVGISAERLQSEWIRELEARIRSEASKLVSEDAYEEARRLAEVGARLIRGPEGESNVWRLERASRRDAQVSYGSQTPIEAPPANAAPRKRRVSVGMAGWRSAAAAIAMAGVLAIGANMYFTAGEDSRVAFYSERQLGKISPHIESGYRNGEGEGPAFVGTLRAQWEGLSAADREASAHAIEEALLDRGISKFMFFDKRRELKLQYADGRLAIH